MRFSFIFLLSFCVFVVSCSLTSTKTASRKDSSKAVSASYELFQQAKSLMEKKLYDPALEVFREFRNTYPLDSLMVEVDLAVADIYYAQKNYIEAQYAYGIYL